MPLYHSKLKQRGDGSFSFYVDQKYIIPSLLREGLEYLFTSGQQAPEWMGSYAVVFETDLDDESFKKRARERQLVQPQLNLKNLYVVLNKTFYKVPVNETALIEKIINDGVTAADVAQYEVVPEEKSLSKVKRGKARSVTFDLEKNQELVFEEQAEADDEQDEQKEDKERDNNNQEEQDPEQKNAEAAKLAAEQRKKQRDERVKQEREKDKIREQEREKEKERKKVDASPVQKQTLHYYRMGLGKSASGKFSLFPDEGFAGLKKITKSEYNNYDNMDDSTVSFTSNLDIGALRDHFKRSSEEVLEQEVLGVLCISIQGQFYRILSNDKNAGVRTLLCGAGVSVRELRSFKVETEEAEVKQPKSSTASKEKNDRLQGAFDDEKNKVKSKPKKAQSSDDEDNQSFAIIAKKPLLPKAHSVIPSVASSGRGMFVRRAGQPHGTKQARDVKLAHFAGDKSGSGSDDEKQEPVRVRDDTFIGVLQARKKIFEYKSQSFWAQLWGVSHNSKTIRAIKSYLSDRGTNDTVPFGVVMQLVEHGEQSSFNNQSERRLGILNGTHKPDPRSGTDLVLAELRELYVESEHNHVAADERRRSGGHTYQPPVQTFHRK